MSRAAEKRPWESLEVPGLSTAALTSFLPQSPLPLTASFLCAHLCEVLPSPWQWLLQAGGAAESLMQVVFVIFNSNCRLT